jgi:hypothetical protein
MDWKENMSGWRMDAGRMLRKGFGVEDISVALKVPVADVRQFVSALRKSGRLSVVLFGRRSR